jgi:spermidine synthase
MARGVTAVLWLCFGLSGAAALALEMLWLRSATLGLGQTAATTATVLAAYFAGIGLGAAWGRGLRQRPVRAYGLLEWGAAAGALWSLAAFRLLATDTAQAWLAASGPLGGVAAVAIAVLPATLCLGATLPALGQALTRRADVGRDGGWLYALNTAGGAVGCALTGFGLPLWIGVSASYVAAAAGSALAGTLALVFARRWAVEGAAPSAPGSNPAPPLRGGDGAPPSTAGDRQAVSPGSMRANHRLRLVAAGAGALGLGLEVMWTRLLAQVLHNSVYSFTAISLFFLLALAAGAALAARLLRRVAPAALAAGALLGGGVFVVAGVWLFVYLTDGLAYVGMRDGLDEYVARIVALAAASAGPAAFASGAVLPALWAQWSGGDTAARPLGDLAAANTLGGIGGALAAGFIAMPGLGVRATLLLAAVCYVVLADLASPTDVRRRWVIYAALLIIVIANPMHAPLVHLRGGRETLRATAEGPSGIVSVVESDGDVQLRLDNYYVLGGSAAAAGERRLGLIPLLLHPAPRRVAFLGLATGITASAAAALALPRTTVVEVVPEVVAVARDQFTPWNQGVLERPDVDVVVDDGRRYLAATRERFDVLVSDLFVPWHQGAGNLYSQEMYASAARRLAPGGLFCQWLPLYQLTRDEFDMIARTFSSVFPQVTLWRADFYPNRRVVGLVGRLTPSRIDLDAGRERMAELPAWSRDALIDSPRGLAMLYAGDLGAAADLFAAAPLNRDDRPQLEFIAPRLTRIDTAGDKDWFTGAALADLYDTLAARDAALPDPLFAATPQLADAQRAGNALYHYALAATQHDDAEAARREAEVRALVPEVVADADAAASVAGLADAQRTLIELRNQQEQVRRRLDEMQRRLGELSHAEPERP